VQWKEVLHRLDSLNVVPLIAITACWVTPDSHLIPFPKKFPQAAVALKKAFQAGTIEIANHGLTHCVVGKHLPRFWSDNRRFHREFWPELPEDVHQSHVVNSQEILESWLEQPVTEFVPPGNVWSIKTYRALTKTNIRRVIANQPMLDAAMQNLQPIAYIDDTSGYRVIHDRDIVLNTTAWRKIDL
jgi:hypothetical protein